MVKVYTAFTREIDNPEEAAREILEQLRPEETMLKNTIGIIMFYYEFVDTGVYKAVADAVPFDVTGCNTVFIGTDKQYGDFAMSLMMITSDDVRFDVKLIENLSGKKTTDIAAELEKTYAEMCAVETPKMIMPFMAAIPQFSGEDLVLSVNSFPQSFPLFGMLTRDMGKKTFVTYNGQVSPDMFSFLVFYGDFNPVFNVTTALAYDNKLMEYAVVTDAAGAVLKSVNNLPATEYLRKIGIIDDADSVKGSGIWAIPAILELKSGVKVARGFFGVVKNAPECVFAAGNIETGAKIAFSYLDGEKTLESADEILKEIQTGDKGNFIGFSCASRSLALGSKYLSEVEKVIGCASEYRRINNTPLNCSVAYAAGEICPVPDASGKLINCLHNYTFITCSFD